MNNILLKILKRKFLINIKCNYVTLSFAFKKTIQKLTIIVGITHIKKPPTLNFKRLTNNVSYIISFSGFKAFHLFHGLSKCEENSH